MSIWCWVGKLLLDIDLQCSSNFCNDDLFWVICDWYQCWNLIKCLSVDYGCIIVPCLHAWCFMLYFRLFFRNKLKFMAFLRKRCNVNPARGPFHYRAPSKILWKTIRGTESILYKYSIVAFPQLCVTMLCFSHLNKCQLCRDQKMQCVESIHH